MCYLCWMQKKVRHCSDFESLRVLIFLCINIRGAKNADALTQHTYLAFIPLTLHIKLKKFATFLFSIALFLFSSKCILKAVLFVLYIQVKKCYFQQLLQERQRINLLSPYWNPLFWIWHSIQLLQNYLWVSAYGFSQTIYWICEENRSVHQFWKCAS